MLILFFVLLTVILPVSATIQSINYPVANEVITETARIKLDVTSSPSSQLCWFTYNNITRNQSISCDGVSLVDLPAASGTYNITVWDNASTAITHQITVIQNNSNIALFTYFLACISILAIIYFTIYLIGKLATLETSITDVAMSYTAYFMLLISYQLSLEYARVTFLLNWQELFISIGGWVMIVFSAINFVICLMFRMMQKKNPKDERVRF